jgi:OPA family sugar phosphate sensor protein UhpC-like MFS transporter
MALAESATSLSGIDARFRKHRIRVMLAITLGYGFIYTCRLGLSIVKKPVIDNGIFTVEELGLIGTGFYICYAAGKFINGFLSDHFQPRLFFAASIFIAAVINLFMGWSTLLWISVGLWALNGWFQGMAAPSAVISITNWFSLHERGRRYGLWNASHSIGEGLTFYVVAAIVAAYGWQYGFIAPGLFCIVAALWVYAFLQNAPPTIGLPDVHEWAGEESEQKKDKTTWQTQKVVFGIRAMWIVALSSALMYVTRYAINSWGILYLQEIRGYSLIDAGFFLSINTAAGIFGSIAYGYLLSLFVIFYGPQNYLLLIIAFALYGAALSGLVASIGGLFGVDIAPRGATGAAMGFVGVFSYVGAAAQDYTTAKLLSQNMTVIDGVRTYDFDVAISFWIGASVLSMLLAASLWKTKIRD